jgi:hypothetical protein
MGLLIDASPNNKDAAVPVYLLGTVSGAYLIFVWPFIVMLRERRRGLSWAQTFWRHITLLAFCGCGWITVLNNEGLAISMLLVASIGLLWLRLMNREYGVPGPWL